jgi:hypothetical protein
MSSRAMHIGCSRVLMHAVSVSLSLSFTLSLSLSLSFTLSLSLSLYVHILMYVYIHKCVFITMLTNMYIFIYTILAVAIHWFARWRVRSPYAIDTDNNQTKGRLMHESLELLHLKVRGLPCPVVRLISFARER